jgi:hypothetical protein
MRPATNTDGCESPKFHKHGTTKWGAPNSEMYIVKMRELSKSIEEDMKKKANQPCVWLFGHGECPYGENCIYNHKTNWKSEMPCYKGDNCPNFGVCIYQHKPPHADMIPLPKFIKY